MATEGVRTIRRAAIGTNVAAGCVVAAAIFLMVNYLSYRHYARFDWTSSSYFTLSDKTEKVLKDLRAPVKVYVFSQPFSRLFDDVKELLGRYAALSRNIQVEYVDPEKDPARVRFLLNKFKISAPAQANLIVFEQGNRNKYVYEKDIVEMDYSGARFRQAPTVKAFKGEQAFTSAVINLTQEKQPVVYLVTGHGEKGIDETGPEGLQVAGTVLERENLKVQKLPLFEKREIPSDCDLLMIVGPRRPYLDDEKKAIQGYLEKGGRLLAALDPQTASGLEPLLRAWDADAGNNLVVDPESARRLFFISPLTFFAGNYGPHDITRDMKGTPTMFSEARSVQPGAANNALRAVALVQTSAAGWGETNTADESFRYEEGQDLKGPVSIAVAVEAQPDKAAASPLKHVRIVVVGDSDFITNSQIGNLSNANLFLNMVNWLTSRERLIAIGPKIPEQTRLRLSGSQMFRIYLFSLAGLPGLSLLLGIVVWWRRRK